jgi:hypothetical protein
MSSQIFEGLASDNILHFNLNSIYVRSPSQRTVSRLIGSSLALYMIGISISPSIAGLLSNFRDSFLMAYAMFMAGLLYLFVVVRISTKRSSAPPSVTDPERHSNGDDAIAGFRSLSFLGSATAPFLFFAWDYWRLMPGLALFLYNAAQSYTFSAIMVHASIHFGFSSRENGFLLTIVHIVASLYLFFVLFAAPRVSSLWSKRHIPSKGEADDSTILNAYLALASLLVQSCSLLLFALAREAWQLYATSALLALGLACPSFIKSYFVAHFEAVDKPRALAALAVMETAGGLVAPILLGGLQTLWPGRGIFVVAACVIALASVLLAGGLLVDHQRRAGS